MASSLPRRLSRVCRRSGRFRRRACWPEGRRGEFGGPGSDAGGGRLLDCAQVQPAGRGSRRSSQSPHRSAEKRPPGQGAGPGGQCRQAGARPPQEPSSPPGAILSIQALIVRRGAGRGDAMKWWGEICVKVISAASNPTENALSWDLGHTQLYLGTNSFPPSFVQCLLLNIHERVSSCFNLSLLFFPPFFYAKNVLYLKQADERLFSAKKCFPT